MGWDGMGWDGQMQGKRKGKHKAKAAARQRQRQKQPKAKAKATQGKGKCNLRLRGAKARSTHHAKVGRSCISLSYVPRWRPKEPIAAWREWHLSLQTQDLRSPSASAAIRCCYPPAAFDVMIRRPCNAHREDARRGSRRREELVAPGSFLALGQSQPRRASSKPARPQA